jgi:membrane protein YqaA with SNARE-associated domain
MLDYLVLFGVAFLAATLFPTASEPTLAAMILSERVGLVSGIAVASLGNTLGSVVNWAVGRFFSQYQDRRWFPVKPSTMMHYQAWYRRWGVWSLGLSWAPIIGDPLTAVAGIMKTPLIIFLPIVAIAKTCRYIVVVWLAGMLF